MTNPMKYGSNIGNSPGVSIVFLSTSSTRSAPITSLAMTPKWRNGKPRYSVCQ